MAVSFYLGRGTVVQVAPLKDGVESEPVPATPTLAAAATKGATSLTIDALPANVLIPAGTYLNFTDSATGNEVLVQLAADAEATDTSLSVVAIPEAIADNSESEWPLTLRARTSADIARGGNRVTSVTFDDDAYERGLTASVNMGLTLNGNWSPQDAGYASAEYWFQEVKQQMYFWVTMPNVKETAYSKGRVYKGVGSITSMPLGIPADGIITGNIEAAFNGKPLAVAPTPTA